MQIIFNILIKGVFICTSGDLSLPTFPGQIYGSISMQTPEGTYYSLPVMNTENYQQVLMYVPPQIVYPSYYCPHIPSLPTLQGHENPHGFITLPYPTNNMIPIRVLSHDMTGFGTAYPQPLHAHPYLPANSSSFPLIETNINHSGIDIHTFRRMIGNIILDPIIFEDPLLIFSSKFSKSIRIFDDINVFYERILAFLSQRRITNERLSTNFIPPEIVVSEIFNQLQDDQVQIGMFFFLYSFISREFTAHGKCIQIIGDILVLGRSEETIMTYEALILELGQWRSLNFKAKTYIEAWEILYEIGNIISLSSNKENRLKYLKGFRNNLYCIMKTIWIDN